MITRDEILSMAREAGFYVREGTIRTMHSNGSWVCINDELTEFAEAVTEKECTARIAAQVENEALKAERARSGLAHRKAVQEAVAEAVAAERERLCAAIKAADDKASEDDYMLDSDDCISVIRGTWNHDNV